MERIYLTPNDALWQINDFAINDDGTTDCVCMTRLCRVGDSEYNAYEAEDGRWYYEVEN